MQLTQRPFNLTESDIKWVNETLSNMTTDEKIGQIFINLCYSFEETYLANILDKYKIGGARYNPGTAKQVYEQNKFLQGRSKIPLLIASNVESGGNGACSDGTMVGTQVQIGATNDIEYAYKLGYVSGREAAAVGCNWAFAPVVDIIYNWRNPVTCTRSYGDDPKLVLEMSKAYFKGLSESNIASAMKHFPGDGIDERDQHIVTSVNTLGVNEWNNSYGTIYKGMIEAGVQSVMIGHIALPRYAEFINPNNKKPDLRPATISKELVMGLLREQLGFNGLILTDATAMIGLTSAMKRCDAVPAAIAAGCDMFLFFKNPEEDLEYMKAGYDKGVISKERLNEAVTRILALKAHLKLHEKQKLKTLVPEESALEIVGCVEHKNMAHECFDKSITLVKNVANQLPIKPSTHKRILLHYVSSSASFFNHLMHGKSDPKATIVHELEAKGFSVTVAETVPEKIAKLQKEANEKGVPPRIDFSLIMGTDRMSDFSKNYDAVFMFANISGFAQNNFVRISWSSPMAAEIPWYVTEVPVVFVSLNIPFHLVDVPMVKTYINAYNSDDDCIKDVIKKIVGDSEFKGKSSVDAFCGLEDTKY